MICEWCNAVLATDEESRHQCPELRQAQAKHRTISELIEIARKRAAIECSVEDIAARYGPGIVSAAAMKLDAINVLDPGKPPRCPKGEHRPQRDANSDQYSCELCGEKLMTGEEAAQLRLLRLRRYDQRASQLADECQTLRDENTQLLAENARLRRAALKALRP